MYIRRNIDVIIIGAGISGLASAHFLEKYGLNTVIVEKASRAGGSIKTESKSGFLVELGPNSTLDTSPIIHEFFTDLGIETEVEYANENARKRYIVRNGQLQALPMSPGSFLTSKLFSSKAKLRLLKEPFIPPLNSNSEETLAEFVTRRLGREFLDYAINPFVAGVYAGLPEKLSVRAAFPKLYALEQKHGSLIKGAVLGARERKKRREVSKQNARLFSFRRGMQTMIDALTSRMDENLYLNSQIVDIHPNDDGYMVQFLINGERHQLIGRALLLTIPVHGYDQFQGDLFQPLLPYLNRIEYPPVTMVFFGYKGNPTSRPLDGFGFLVPEKENRKILGTIWSSTIFSGRAPQKGTAFTTFVGGSRQPEVALLPETKLVELVKQDLKDLLGISAQPDIVVIKLWQKAIPQYQIGHEGIIQKVESFERAHPGIYISGNFRGGISIGDCIKQTKANAERIKNELGKNEIFDEIKYEYRRNSSV